MAENDFLQRPNALSYLRDDLRIGNIIDTVQASELVSDAIQELQNSMDKISALEKELLQWKMDSARFKEELDRERALMSEIFRQAPTGIVVVEVPTGKAIRTNKMAKIIMGDEDVLFQNLESHKSKEGPALFHLDGTPCEFEEMPLMRSILNNEIVTNEELIFMRKDGSQGFLNVSAGPIFNGEGNLIAAVGTFYETTRYRQMGKNDSGW